MTQIILKGDDALIAALKNMSDEIREEVGKVVTGTAIELRKDVVRRINNGPATGRVYQKYNPKRVHQASAPGEAPMKDTGRLQNSITFNQVGGLTATVGSRLVYALHLEYGTRNMAARPYFRPAVEAMRDKFSARLSNAVSRAMK